MASTNIETEESLDFPLKDLSLTSYTQNNGQARAKVISFLVEQLKYYNWDLGKYNSMFSLPSHVLDLILHEYNTTCEISADNGLVSVLLDILSSFYLHPSKSDILPYFKYVIPMLLVVHNFL